MLEYFSSFSLPQIFIWRMGVFTIYDYMLMYDDNLTKEKNMIQDSLCDCHLKFFDDLSSTLLEVIQCIESTVVLICLFLFAKFMQMWFVMERVQNSFTLSERLVRAIHRGDSWHQTSSLGDAAYAADTIERLLADGADVNQSSGNLLPLHCACVVGDPSCVKLLLFSGAKVNSVDGYKCTALHYAAEKSVPCVELLLQHGAATDAGDANECTPLHWAAYKNRHQCARLLLDAGANPNAADASFDTPLSVAALKGHLETARVLLDYNANVDVFNLSGKSPICRLVQTIAAGIGSAQDDALLALLLKACGNVYLTRPRLDAGSADLGGGSGTGSGGSGFINPDNDDNDEQGPGGSGTGTAIRSETFNDEISGTGSGSMSGSDLINRDITNHEQGPSGSGSGSVIGAGTFNGAGTVSAIDAGTGSRIGAGTGIGIANDANDSRPSINEHGSGSANRPPAPVPDGVAGGDDVFDMFVSRRDIRQLLAPFYRQPRSLLQLSRRAVRSHVTSGHLPTLAKRLPLPPALRRYVALKD